MKPYALYVAPVLAVKPPKHYDWALGVLALALVVAYAY